MPVNESNTIQYTVNTSRVPDGTTLYWKTTGNTTNSDIVGGNTGSITITNNQAVFNVTIANDVDTDGTKTLGISLSTGSLNGPTVVSTANPITINDTSISPPPIRLYSWGYNFYGTLGLNDTVNRSSPTQVGTGTDWSIISIGTYNSAALKTNGTLWTWGNGSSQLGLNDEVSRSSPTQVGSTTNWSQVDTGFDSTIATKTDGTLWTWGGNFYGQLGNNVGPQSVFDQRPKSSPTQVGVSTNWNKVGSSDRYTVMATKTDGTLWTWGRNHQGQLGHNDRVDKSSPTQIGSGTDWNLLCTSTYTTLAIKTNGTLWSWGSNSWGQLGLNFVSGYRSSPVQVGSATNWSQVSGSWFSTMAIKTDGTLWSWGNNSNGQLGLNDRTYRISPVQMGTDTNWSLISVGNYSTIATKTDGTLWTWGRNHNGQLGEDDIVNRSSPVQVGIATNWTQINAGQHNNLAITSN
jgi:alpha-tubulin suppressor-like RCC1 family protein